MTDFLLELRSEEIPARMQGKAREDLARLFTAELAAAGLAAGRIATYATPRRLALIAHGLPDRTEATAEEVKARGLRRPRRRSKASCAKPASPASSSSSATACGSR